ncbi:hypothetical protein FGB62_10g38 [Gracilaria domingensis]|nr:hypothetical protein FGB62_162g011 [Gracilaria domingensis]KAI0566303.1 hypothetical protein FGB62_10g38 [Gracilaria domingensis]
MVSQDKVSILLAASFVGLFSIGLAQSSCIVVKDLDYHLSLSVDDLFDATTNGNKIGTCFISENSNPRAACYLYARCPGYAENGCPFNNNGRGTGCVKAPDFPKAVNTCYYRSGYDQVLTSQEIDSFCTEDGKVNAVNQIKWALSNGYCNLPACVPPESCTSGSPGCKCTCGGGVGVPVSGFGGFGVGGF